MRIETVVVFYYWIAFSEKLLPVFFALAVFTCTSVGAKLIFQLIM